VLFILRPQQNFDFVVGLFFLDKSQFKISKKNYKNKKLFYLFSIVNFYFSKIKKLPSYIATQY